MFSAASKLCSFRGEQRSYVRARPHEHAERHMRGRCQCAWIGLLPGRGGAGIVGAALGRPRWQDGAACAVLRGRHAPLRYTECRTCYAVYWAWGTPRAYPRGMVFPDERHSRRVLEPGRACHAGKRLRPAPGCVQTAERESACDAVSHARSLEGRARGSPGEDAARFVQLAAFTMKEDFFPQWLSVVKSSPPIHTCCSQHKRS